MSRETKTLQFKVKATGVTTDENGDRLGHLEIYGASFDNVDEGNDRINKGAFTRTIQNSKARAIARGKKYALKMLWQHDTNEIIGGWEDLSEDAEGLRAKGDVALKTKRGAEFYELAELEMIDEFSIIYEVMPGGAKYDKSGVRDLTELRLFSIDPVTFPMNDNPHVIKIKCKDDGKHMDKKIPEKKDFNTLFQAAQAQDSLEDWCDLVDTLTQAMMQAFCQGDEPQGDMGLALEQFGSAVDKWTSSAVECGLPDYMSDRYGYSDNQLTPYVPYSMRMGGYDSMSRHASLEQKAGKPISAANQSNIDDHVANVHAIANEATKAMKSSMKAIHDAADGFASKMAGNQADSDNSGDKDTQTEKSYNDALRELKALRA